jgi:hypothetical protein
VQKKTRRQTLAQKHMHSDNHVEKKSDDGFFHMAIDDFIKHFKATSFCQNSEMDEFEPHLAYYDFRGCSEKKMAFFTFDLE